MVKRILAIIGLAVCLLWPAPPRNELHVIDVGQGDAILLTTAGGHSLLMDGGPDANLLGDLSRDLRGHTLDVMVVSHYDADHVSGFPAVLRAYQVKEIWLPALAPTTQVGLEVYRLSQAEGAVLRTPVVGDTLHLDDFQIQVLAPDLTQPASADSSTNDLAYVLGVSLGATNVLLTADAPSERTQQAWARWTQTGTDFVAPLEVLKVGHHGSRTSTTAPLLKQLSPQVAVISVGARNRYHHPSPETMQALTAQYIPTWRTDQQGSFDLLLYPDGRTTLDHRFPGILAWIFP